MPAIKVTITKDSELGGGLVKEQQRAAARERLVLAFSLQLPSLDGQLRS
jgi:hypothetical protein